MSLNTLKTDSELGIKVLKHLEEKGVHTPGNFLNKESDYQINQIAKHFGAIMDTLGLDLKNDSLEDTPKRVAKMYVNEIFWGLVPTNFPKCTTVENEMNYDGMVIERNISVQSNCEHHFIVIDGFAHIAYIPNKKVLGLSKLNRIVEYFSKRPQIQERLTKQIFHALEFILQTEDIAVIINAQHFCVKSRGVEDNSSDTITSSVGGLFKSNRDLRNEFLNLVKL